MRYNPKTGEFDGCTTKGVDNEQIRIAEQRAWEQERERELERERAREWEWEKKKKNIIHILLYLGGLLLYFLLASV